ncbi:MAG: ABC transporter ATP-binding protein [Candidatus Bipolaricaulia bacterium]
MAFTEPLLAVKDLEVHFEIYEGTVRVLNGVNLVVGRGEKVGLVGETGCGKSVTMKTIMGTLPIPPGRIVGGEIEFKGRDLLQLSRQELQKIKGKEISMVFQDPMNSLNPVFKIGTQLTDIIRFSGDKGRSDGLNRSEVTDRAIEVLQAVQLPDPERIMESYPLQLSGGMRQRVLIAMALANEPELLIADEPGTALDVTVQDQILELLKELVQVKNISVLLITHNLGVVRETTDRVYVMYAGNIVEEAPTPELFANPKHPYTQGLLNSVPKLTGEGITSGIAGRIPDYLDPPPGCRFHPRCEFAMPICQQSPPPFQVGDEHHAACFLYRTHDEADQSKSQEVSRI